MSLNLLNKIQNKIQYSRINDPFQQGPTEVDRFLGTFQLTHTGTERDPYAIFKPLPPYSTILGVCSDGLPLLLDLNDPKPGAILIYGAQQTGKSRLLRSILLSACCCNTTEDIYFYLITPNPGLYSEIGNLDHCYGIFSSYDRAACEMIVDLASLVEQRKTGRHLGAKCILAIDNLYELIKHQDFEVINHLKWLFKYGASNGIRVISTLETERSNLIEKDLLIEQKTQIIAGSNTCLLPDTDMSRQYPEEYQSYRTRIGVEWVDFWIPATGKQQPTK